MCWSLQKNKTIHKTKQFKRNPKFPKLSQTEFQSILCFVRKLCKLRWWNRNHPLNTNLTLLSTGKCFVLSMSCWKSSVTRMRASGTAFIPQVYLKAKQGSREKLVIFWPRERCIYGRKNMARNVRRSVNTVVVVRCVFPCCHSCREGE